MEKGILNAGLGIAIAFEKEAGVRPTEGWMRIPLINNMPSLYATPETVDATTFDNMKYTSSIPGLQSQDVREYTMLLNNDTWAMWSDICDQFDTAQASGLAMWCCHYHPKIDKANFFMAEPTRIVMDGGDPNNALTVTLPLTPSGEIEEGAKPTTIAEYVPAAESEGV